ncbi:DegT/DnrJ/EryC1/StrS family aminotransferase [Actinokineospora sp. NBRC 105648]|uniref:DegT/DnrJ/EryC1/StrS family aminotransferase n=1 Tax=Actinokineospora sp. NBRC 105648 TaxID=3032206 RepID=UPI0024A34E71|nr:DegT/DnrJ/EryC1/StrS family aminotransferase [Actinokineospora sp. NBRC 105648]GLZ38310.1 glutamine--scyllo-inositol aminotransferase [Actinokineospora sp. NBRC 105648]
MTGPIPLVDLAAQHAAVAEEVAAGWSQVLAKTAFVGGPQVAAFEAEYAEFSGAAHCIGVGNGTDALEFALRALEIGPGDECIVPANTFIATAEAVARTGATVVLVDCDPDTALIDPTAAAAAVTTRTRAVLPVDLYGQVAPIEKLRALLPANVAIVEDAAQSQGATRHGETAGSLGDIAATSFYPGKNLGAYGDAGAVTTSRADLAERVRLLGAHGSPRKYEHPVLGFNSRLDTLQAVVLSAKLRRLAGWNAARREAADRYTALLSEVDGVVTPVVAEGNVPVWHLYVVRVADRDTVLGKLHAEGIGAGIHYPTPVHLTGAFADLGLGAGAFPNAELLGREILSLPLFPEITPAQQERVVSVVADAVRS